MNKKISINNKKETYFLGGRHTCLEAIKNPKRVIKKIYVNDQKKYDEIINLSKKNSIEIKDRVFFENIFNKTFNHQGYAVETYLLEYLDFKNFAEEISKFQSCTVVILDSIQDDRNLGSIMRTCLSFYVDALILNKKEYRPKSYNLNKTAAGSIEHLKIYTVSNVKNAIQELKKKGFWIYALDQNATKSIYNVELNKFTVLVLGSEEKGIKKNTYNYCDDIISIPINPLANSLNISNALSASLSIIKKTRLNK